MNLGPISGGQKGMKSLAVNCGLPPIYGKCHLACSM